jgi:predicted GH43/DUF377 family glycosyl hydrolase
VRWSKQGRVYVPPGDVEWARAYAFPPTPVEREDGILRLYVGFCDENIVGRCGWVDVKADDPGQVVGVSERPVLDIGEPGMFDENGILPSSVISVDDKLYMYYTGYQLGHGVKYYMFHGLAISEDGGESFQRASRVPVTDRSDAEPMNRTSGFVRLHDDRFQMWYVGGDSWTKVGEKPLPIYNMRYLESDDGITWGPEGKVCMDFDIDDEHAFGRPWVWESAKGMTMMYSVRTRSKDYRLGLAYSSDGGLNWERHDDEVGIDVSPEGWDSELIAYSAIWTSPGGQTYLFYNGNARGKTGFGYATLEED